MGFFEKEVTPGIQSWLLKNPNPSVRYLTLRDLTDHSFDNPDVVKARTEAHSSGKIPEILSHMDPKGFWIEPGAGYLKKYFSIVWSLITLAQLGADVDGDPRIKTACNYYLSHAMTENGQISINGNPSSIIDCLQGNMCAALLDLRFQDERLEKCFDWLARSVTGEGVAPMGTKDTSMRYYSGKIGQDFQCGANNKLACAWGAVKVMLALSKYPREKQTPLIKSAIEHGVNFLLSIDPVTAQYPSGYAEKPSGNWWKFGFPVFYITDLLQLAEALVDLGYGNDPRMANLIAFIKEKRNPEGYWLLETSYSGKIWSDFGKKKEPNPWVTIRALRTLKKSTEVLP